MRDSRHELGAAGRALLAWLVILGLVVAVGYLVSERNARIWSLVPEDGRLVVKKGLFLPMGSAAFRPSDPTLAKVYAPLVVPPSKALPAGRTFVDQGELDRALYDLLSGWAHEDIAAKEPARMERGLGYVERALDLPGLSTAQRDDLATLRAESGFFEARRLLEKARAELSEAVEKLRLTAGSRSPHAPEAAALLRDVGTAMEVTTAAVRASGAGPAEATPGPTPEGRPAEPPAGK
jgi:hypothetical protein